MKIKYKTYLNSDKWDNMDRLDELMEKHVFAMTKKATERFKGSLYEVEFEMELDTETGESKIISVKET